MECFNIAPEHRYAFACLFFVALLPPSVKDYNRLYGHILDLMEDMHAFSGFDVKDEKGRSSTLNVELARKVHINHLRLIILYLS